MDQYLTPKDVARIYSISEQTVKNWLRSGKLPGFKVGKVWRISHDDLIKLHEK